MKKKNIVVYAEDTTVVPVRFLLSEIIGMDDASIKHTQNPRKADISFLVKENGHQEAYKTTDAKPNSKWVSFITICGIYANLKKGYRSYV